MNLGAYMFVVKIAFVFLLLSVNTSTLYAQNLAKLRIGVDGSNPPFAHQSLDGVFSGFDIEMASALCKKMKAQCSFIQLSWSKLIPALQAKEVDLVVASFRQNSKNSALVSFSNPYLLLPGMMVVRKDTILSGTNVEDLQSTQLGTLSSSSHAEYLRVHYRATHVNTYKSQPDLFKDLAQGKLDGVVGHPIVLGQWLNMPNAIACCRYLGSFPYDANINGNGLAIGVGNGREKLLAQINKALKAITKSGVLAKITKTHLPFLQLN